MWCAAGVTGWGSCPVAAGTSPTSAILSGLVTACYALGSPSRPGGPRGLWEPPSAALSYAIARLNTPATHGQGVQSILTLRAASLQDPLSLSLDREPLRGCLGAEKAEAKAAAPPSGRWQNPPRRSRWEQGDDESS